MAGSLAQADREGKAGRRQGGRRQKAGGRRQRAGVAGRASQLRGQEEDPRGFVGVRTNSRIRRNPWGLHFFDSAHPISYNAAPLATTTTKIGSTPMAYDANAKNLIKTLKLSRQKYEVEIAKFSKKFIMGDAVPTEEDVENLEKLIKNMQTAANKMHEDVSEISGTIQTFGGMGDAVIGNAKIMYKTLKSKLPK
jgi:hypothetical protein